MPTKSACWMLAGPAYILCLSLFGSVHYFIVLERESDTFKYRSDYGGCAREVRLDHVTVAGWGGTYVNDDM